MGIRYDLPVDVPKIPCADELIKGSVPWSSKAAITIAAQSLRGTFDIQTIMPSPLRSTPCSSLDEYCDPFI